MTTTTTRPTADQAGHVLRALDRAGLVTRSDAGTHGMYASDASLYRVPPIAVVRPRDADEVAAALAAARESGVPLTARGAGTSVAGNAVAPAACAIVIPIALRFATRHSIHPLLMSMMVIQGTTAGGFSPIGIYGVIVNGISAKAGLDTSPGLLFLGTFSTTSLVALVAFAALGGRTLLRRRADIGGDGETGTTDGTHGGGGGAAVRTRTGIGGLTIEQTLTLVAIAALVALTLVWGMNVGFAALTLAVALSLLFTRSAKEAVTQIAWSTVLLIGGIVTYVALLESQGTIEWLGALIAEVDAPLLAAFIILLIGAVVSAFASTTAILGVVIPLATPFLLTDQIGVTGLVIALSVSSSVVDCSPLSTMGALAVANTAEADRDRVFSGLMRWGMSLIVIAPIATFAALVLPSTF